MRALTTYWHTLRHLRPGQVYHQVRRALLPLRLLSACTPPGPAAPLTLRDFPGRPLSYLGGGVFCFLHQEHDCGWPIAWQPRALPLLWQYNLHYFDFLHQPGLPLDTGLALMRSWIAGHPPASGAVGWQPYPLSLRLVNWLKFFSRHGQPPADIWASLALQAANLHRQIEYHILGNHLFANAKALWYAGRCLGQEPLAQLGRTIIADQIQAQFLPDGGHFELSPMYHALMLEDLLDLMNLIQASGHPADTAALPQLTATAAPALGWLAALCDSQGRIPLLNDAAYHIAPEYQDLAAYAARLGLSATTQNVFSLAMASGWQAQCLSGYWVLTRPPFRLIFDTAPLGPDYLPGHAHCDMLSILLDLDESPIFTDTGVYEYAEGPRRHYARSTAAHNTVQLDGLEQAQIWKSFRMARRGSPQDLQWTQDTISCRHNGFAVWQPGLSHTRQLHLTATGFQITDHCQGPQHHHFTAFFHCAPGLAIEPRGRQFLLANRLLVEPWGAAATITTSDYYPEFGRLEQRPCLVLQGDFHHSASFGITCTLSS